MADQREAFRQWLEANPEKQGTYEYDTIAAAYEKLTPRATPTGPIRKTAADLLREYDERQAAAARAQADAEDYGDRSAFGRGFSRGVDLAGSQWGSFVEGLGNVSGIEALTQMGREQITENERQLAAQEQFATRRKDVKDVDTALDYFLETLGETAPLTGTSIAAALSASALAPAALPAAATTVAGMGAAAISQLPFFYGGNRERQKEAIQQGLRTELSEGAAVLSAIPQAAMDAIAEGLQIRGMTLLGKALAGGGIFTKGVKGIAAGAVSEVPTEIGQALIERAQAGLPVDSPDAIEEYIDVGVAAGLIGGTVGGVGGAYRGLRDKAAPPPPSEDDLRRERRAQREAEREAAEIETAFDDDAGEPTITRTDEPVTSRVTEDKPAPVPEAAAAQAPPEKAATPAAPQVGTVEAALEANKAKPYVPVPGRPKTYAVRGTTAIVTRKGKKWVIEVGGQEVSAGHKSRQAAYNALKGNPTLAAVQASAAAATTQPSAEPQTAQEEAPPAQPSGSPRQPAPAPTRAEKQAKARNILDEGWSEETIQRWASETDKMQTLVGRINSMQDRVKARKQIVQGLKDASLTPEQATQALSDIGYAHPDQIVKNSMPTPSEAFRPRQTLTTKATTERSNNRTVYAVTDSADPDTSYRIEFDKTVPRREGSSRKGAWALKDTDGNTLLTYPKVADLKAAITQEPEVGMTTNETAMFTVQDDGTIAWTRKPAPVGQRLPVVERRKPRRRFSVKESKQFGKQLGPRAQQQQAQAAEQAGATTTAKPQVKPKAKASVSKTQAGTKKKRTKQVTERSLVAKKPYKTADQRHGVVVDKTNDPEVRALYEGKAPPTPDTVAKVKDALTKAIRELEIEATTAERLARLDADYDALPNKDLELVDEALLETDLPFVDSVGGAVDSGNATAALEQVGQTAQSRDLRRLAKVLARNLGGTKVRFREQNNPGAYDPRTNTIYLNPETGNNLHTLMHEATHAVTSAAIARGTGPTYNELKSIYEATKDMLGTAYGAQNLDEFVAEAFSNPKFRAELATINPHGKPLSSLRQLTNAIFKMVARLFGADITTSAKARLDYLVENLMAPAPEYRDANQLAMASDEAGVKRTMGVLGQVSKGLPKPTTTQKDTMQELWGRLNEQVGRIGLSLLDIQGVADIAAGVGLDKYVRRVQKIAETMKGDMTKSDDRVRAVVKMATQWVAAAGTEAHATLDRLIYDLNYGATVMHVDPRLTLAEAKVRYKRDAEKLQAWRDQRADWNKLKSTVRGGVSGVDVYNAMQNLHQKQFKDIEAVLTKNLQDVVSPDEFTRIKKDVLARLFDKDSMDTYFPMMREGRYKVAYSLKPTSDAVQQRGEQAYQMIMVDNRAAAERLVADLKVEADVDTVYDPVDTEFDATMFRRDAPPTAFVNQLLGALDKPIDGVTMSADTKKALENQIINVYVNQLPATSVAHSLRKRKETPGFLPDSLHALRTKAFDMGRQTVRMAKTAEVLKLEADLQAQPYSVLKDPKFSQQRYGVIQREIMDRANFVRNPTPEMWPKVLNQIAFAYTIGFNVSSAIVNMSQIPLFVYPYLIGKYGVGPATKAMFRATGKVLRSSRVNSDEWLNVGIDTYYTRGKNGQLIPRKDLSPADTAFARKVRIMAETAGDHGRLTNTFLMDTLALSELGHTGRLRQGNKALQMLDKVTAASAVIFQYAERLNHQAAMIMAYELEIDAAIAEAKKAGKNVNSYQDLGTTKLREIAEGALRTTQETSGGSTLETAPRITQKGLPRVAFMYKSYGLRMYWTMMKMVPPLMKKMLGKDVPAGQAEEAAKQVTGILLSSLFFAGVQGVPIYGAAKMIADSIYDDEEEDWDTRVRTYLKEGLYKGVVTDLIDVDVASRIRLSQLLIQDNRYNKDASPEELLVFYAFGPAGSTGGRLWRGIEDLQKGNIERGVESLLPAGIANMYKATLGRYQREGGIRTRRGDPIYDDLTGGELVAQFFGFAPAEYTRRQEENNVYKGIEKAILTRKSDLMRKYHYARFHGDDADTAEVLKEIKEFNERHGDKGVAITVESVMRSLKGYVQTTSRMHNGVTYNPRLRAALQEMMDDWEDAK